VVPEVARHHSLPHRLQAARSPLEQPSKPATESDCPGPPEARWPEPFTRQPQPSRAAGSASPSVEHLPVHETPRIERLRPPRPAVSGPPASAAPAPPSVIPAPPLTRSVPSATKIPASPPGTPTIRVSIGRVEVRLVAPPAPPSPSPPSQPKPAMSLDEYLRGRHGGRA
jgi:hypothetical protein